MSAETIPKLLRRRRRKAMAETETSWEDERMMIMPMVQ